MRQLFTMDTREYDSAWPVRTRPSVRGLVIREGRILMIHSAMYDYYKFPGGGMEPGESRSAALCREVREESGFTVDPASVREYGLVLRRSKGKGEWIFHQENFYYLCTLSGTVGQQLDDYEAEEGFTPEWVKPEYAIETNRFHDHKGKWGVVQERECLVLEKLLAEGYFL